MLKEALAALHNDFEPDNQSRIYRKIAAYLSSGNEEKVK